MKCVRCGKEIDDASKFCCICGAEQVTSAPSGESNTGERKTSKVLFSRDFEKNDEPKVEKKELNLNGNLIIQTVNDFGKERTKYLRMALLSVIGGVLGLSMGVYFLMIYEKTYFDNDTMEFLAFAMGMIIALAGFVLLICAALCPIIAFTVVGKNTIRVYGDHVEGTARRYVGNYGKFQDFNLKYSDILSAHCKAVTVSSAIVEIMLPDGSAIRSAAENANEVVEQIQKRLG